MLCIHLLYKRMAGILIKLTIKFIQKQYLLEKKDGQFIAKSFTSILLNIDATNSDFRKEVITVDISTDEKQVGFKSNVLV